MLQWYWVSRNDDCGKKSNYHGNILTFKALLIVCVEGLENRYELLY